MVAAALTPGGGGPASTQPLLNQRAAQLIGRTVELAEQRGVEVVLLDHDDFHWTLITEDETWIDTAPDEEESESSESSESL